MIFIIMDLMCAFVFFCEQACKFLDEQWSPKFTLIIAQKNHHTKFFQPGSPDNVPPGEFL